MNVTQLLRAIHARSRASFLAVALPLSFAGAVGVAAAQNVIEDVAVAKGAAGRTTMTFAMKEALAAPPSRPKIPAAAVAAGAGAVGGVAYGLVRPRTRRFGRGGDYLTGIACVYAYMLAFLVPLALLGVEPLLYTRMGAGVFVLLGTVFGLVVGHFWFRDDPAENGGV